MHPERSSFLGFVGRTLWPFLLFILFLSIGINAFFLTVDRFRDGTLSSSTAASNEIILDSLARGQRAFGVIERTIAVKPQKGTPVSVYRLPEALPEFPARAKLFRDQGADLVATDIRVLSEKLGVPYGDLVKEQPFFARSLVLRSADRATELSIDGERRVLTVKRRALNPGAGTLSDAAESRAIARAFAEELGIDVSALGDPVAQTGGTVGGRPVSGVIWNAMFDDKPLYDSELRPMPMLSVEVDRTAHAVTAATVSLLRPDILASSEYPLRPSKEIKASLGSGGLMPISGTGKGEPLTFDRVELAYMLVPATSEIPAYILPIVVGSGVLPNGTRVSTFVPAVDKAWWKWE